MNDTSITHLEYATTTPNVEDKDSVDQDQKYTATLQGMGLNGIENAAPIESIFVLRDKHDNEEAYMPKGKVGLIAGYGGTGKSLLALELALLVAHPLRAGRPKGKYGQALVTQPTTKKVAIFFGEEDQAGCAWRLRQAFQSLGVLDSYQTFKHNLLIVPLGGVPFSTAFVNKAETDSAKEWFNALKSRVEDFGGDDGLDLIIVDPLSHFGGGEFEQDNGQAVELMRKLTELTSIKGNPTVLGIHHSAKKSKDGRLDEMLRGSSALKDNSRWVAVLTRLGEDKTGRRSLRWESNGISREIVELEIAKSNYTKRGQPLRFAIGPDGMTEITESIYLRLNAAAMKDDDIQENGQINPEGDYIKSLNKEIQEEERKQRGHVFGAAPKRGY